MERAILHKACRSPFNPDLYTGNAEIWRCNKRTRIRTFQWFPPQTVLVLYLYDVDRFAVDVPATMRENGFTFEWLNENEPGNDDFQIPLF